MIILLQGNVLLGGLGSWDSSGHHMTPATHLNTVVDQRHPLKAAALSSDPLQDNAPWHTAETAQERLEEHNEELREFTWPPNSPDPIRSSICGMGLNKSDPWRPHPPTYWIQRRIHYKLRLYSFLVWCRNQLLEIEETEKRDLGVKINKLKLNNNKWTWVKSSQVKFTQVLFLHFYDSSPLHSFNKFTLC